MCSHTKYRNAVLLVYHLVKNKTRRSIRVKRNLIIEGSEEGRE